MSDSHGYSKKSVLPQSIFFFFFIFQSRKLLFDANVYKCVIEVCVFYSKCGKWLKCLKIVFYYTLLPYAPLKISGDTKDIRSLIS